MGIKQIHVVPYVDVLVTFDSADGWDLTYDPATRCARVANDNGPELEFPIAQIYMMDYGKAA